MLRFFQVLSTVSFSSSSGFLQAHRFLQVHRLGRPRFQQVPREFRFHQVLRVSGPTAAVASRFTQIHNFKRLKRPTGVHNHHHSLSPNYSLILYHNISRRGRQQHSFSKKLFQPYPTTK